jgi:hypothetical protein
VVSTDLRIFAMFYIMSAIPYPPPLNDTFPSVFPTIGSMSIKNAQASVDGHNAPLGATDRVALSIIMPWSDTTASPTMVL